MESPPGPEFHLPPPAAGAEGLEDFVVEGDGVRLGRVAAVNRAPDGLVLIVDDRTAYRVLPAQQVAQIDIVGGRVVLGPEGKAALAAAPTVFPRQTLTEGDRLVRYLPTELNPLVTVAGSPPRHSPLWLLAIGAVLFAGALIFPVDLLVESDVGGPFRWAWIALPLVSLGVAVWAVLKAVDADRGEPTPVREKLTNVLSFLLGISPRRSTRH